MIIKFRTPLFLSISFNLWAVRADDSQWLEYFANQI